MSAVREAEVRGCARGSIEVVEASQGRARRDTIRCIVGKHLAINPDALSAYCFRQLSTRVDDLVLIAASVAFTDRCIARHAAFAWRRELELSVPVHEPEFWGQPIVLAELTALLELLTGDTWVLHFRKRRVATATRLQETLSLSHGSKPIVLPFSDGIDSFAGSRLMAASEPEATLLLVTAGSRSDADRAWRERHLNARRYRLVLPFKFLRAGPPLREMSYRSRALVYGAMAAIAAHLSGGERVIYTESGQGSVGPWLVPVGNEAPDIRMNPIFTHRLASFFSRVLGTSVRFEHPRLWSTKGETLRDLVKLGRTEDWNKTRSCARDARHMSADGKLMQCGVCAGCLLRRQSLLAAGLNEREEQSAYLWSDLTVSMLDAAVPRKLRKTTVNDKRQAVCGFLALAQLADLSGSHEHMSSLTDYSHKLARALEQDETDVRAKLARLLQAHRSEWLAFLDHCGPKSFLNAWACERS